MYRLLAPLLLLVVAASAPAADYRQHPDMLALVDELVAEHGLDRTAVTTLLADARRRQPILDAIARPAERVATWASYRPRFIEESRISLGAEFWRKHAAALARAEDAHGVPAEIIIAIIGVETRYGRNKGSWPVVDALATLAFDYPPRAPFFRQQLKEFVLLENSAHIDLAGVRGSYAGAMGFPQFMPSSYRNFAVDFDGDGSIDLINNPVDAIGSVANYLRAHGWQPGEPVAARMAVTGDGHAAVTNQGLDPKFTVAEIGAAGLAIASCLYTDGIPADYCADPAPDARVSAWKLDGSHGAEYWAGLPNFFAITRYNRSEKYSLAVLQLAEEIRKRHRAQGIHRG